MSGGSPSTHSPSRWPGPSVGATTCLQHFGATPSRSSTTRCAHPCGGATPTRSEGGTRGSGVPWAGPVPWLHSPPVTDATSTSSAPVVVSEALEATDELVEAFVRLIPQLS